MQTISRDDLDRVFGGVTININLGSLLQQLMQAQGGAPAGPQDPSAQQAAPPQQAAPQQGGGGGGGLNIGSLMSMFSGLMGGQGGGGQGGSQGGGGQGGAPSMAGGAGMMGG